MNPIPRTIQGHRRNGAEVAQYTTLRTYTVYMTVY
jgi:hypothetical protein